MTRKTYTSAQLKGKKLVINKNKYGVTTGHSVVDKPKKSSRSSSSSSSSRSKPKDVNTGVSEAPRYNPFTNPAPNTSTENGPVYSPPPQVSSSPVPSAGSSNDSRTILQKIGDLIKAPFAPNENLKPVSEDGSKANRLANANEAIKNAITLRGVESNTGVAPVDTVLSAAASNPYITAFPITKGLQLLGIGGKASGAAATTLVDDLAKVGTKGVKEGVKSTADTFASNTATHAKTGNWLSKLFAKVEVKETISPVTGNVLKTRITRTLPGGLTKNMINPTVATSMIIGAIGTYPFAGFIKEEALQTLSFGVKTAISNGDLDGAEAAAAEIDDVLNPGVIRSIISGLPGPNVIASLLDFFNSASIKNEIDKKIISDLKIGRETGTVIQPVGPDGTPSGDLVITDKFYGDIGEQRIATEEKIAEIKANSTAAILKLEEDARLRGNEQQAAYWKGVYEQIDARAAKQSKANEDYWFEYFKNLSNNSGSSKSSYEPPSNLNFGLL